jgi:hypothetical protein
VLMQVSLQKAYMKFMSRLRESYNREISIYNQGSDLQRRKKVFEEGNLVMAHLRK